MADAKISSLTALTGANVDPAADILPIVDTSVTTTKKILVQELMNALSTLTSLTGAGTDTAADSLPIYDNSATTEKKILVSELQIAMGLIAATQAQQEAGSSTATFTSPGRQHFHPSACKAWGFATSGLVVTTSYPSAGTSVTGSVNGFTVTHGVTFSSANYAVTASHGSTTLNSFALTYRITGRTATQFTITFYDIAGNVSDPTNFSYTCFGDL